MKKSICLLLALAMMLAMTACQTATGIVMEKDSSGVVTNRIYSEADEDAVKDFKPLSEGGATTYLAEKDGKQYIVMETSQTFADETELESILNSEEPAEEPADQPAEEEAPDGYYVVEPFNKGGRHCVRITYFDVSESEEPGTEEPAAQAADMMEDVFMTLSLKAPLGAEAFGTEYFTTEEDGAVTIDTLRESFAGNKEFGLIGVLYEITELPFKDVKAADWFHDAVLKAYGEGLIAGTSKGLFTPDGSLTHAQALTMACAIRTAYEGDSIRKADEGPWYAPFQAYAKEKGMYDGRFDGKMDVPVTREQMAYYFSNALPAEKYGKTVDKELNDIAGTEFVENIGTLVKSGVVSGYPDGTFLPKDEIKRSEAASILANIFKLIAE